MAGTRSSLTSDGVKDQSGLGNDWNVLNLNLGGDFTHSSAHGSNVTTAEFAKMVDSDLNTYGEGAAILLVLLLVKRLRSKFKILLKTLNFSTFSLPPIPHLILSTAELGAFLEAVLVAISGHSMPTSTEMGTFTVPSNYAGTGRIYFSGNNTDFRVYDISPASDTAATQDIIIDTPVNGNEASTGAGGERRGNYCCFNPLDKHSSLTISDGSLKVQASTTQWELARSTFFLSSGKHYWEFTRTGSVTSSSGVQMGLKTPESTLSAAAAQAGSTPSSTQQFTGQTAL